MLKAPPPSFAPELPVRRLLFALSLSTLAAAGCGPIEDADGVVHEDHELEPFDDESNIAQQGIVDCTPRTDTGYSSGKAFPITVVSADGRPAEMATANAYYVMQQAAARDGVGIRVVSGFRTMSEQQRLYACYRNCNCNGCNLAASPGYSNHQSGHALDLNTSSGAVLRWLNANGARFGFKRTVPSEPWHWEWWGGGPGGGPCGAQAQAPAKPIIRYEPLVGDFNGDGKADLATLSPNGGGGWSDWYAMELTAGSGFQSTVWTSSTPRHMRNGGAPLDYRFVTGDFNGDGKTDVATLSPNGGGAWKDWIAMDLSTGSGFASTVWVSSTPMHIRNGGGLDYRTVAGDFNGDGKTDLATVGPSGGGGWADWIAVDLSTGSGFASTVWLASTARHMHNVGPADYRVLTGDFNGDGKTDLATISPNAAGGWSDWTAMELSTGKGFQSTVWVTATQKHMRNTGAQDYRVLAADFDGNGKTDLATVSTNAGGGWAEWTAMELSTGAGFNSTVWVTPTPQHIRNGGGHPWGYRVVSGDFDGNGKADLATVSTTGGGAWDSWVLVNLSNGAGWATGGWGASTPAHMRNGGASSHYQVLVGDFDGNKRSDLVTISANGGGAWRDWTAMEMSTGSSFWSTVRTASTPAHIRNGGY